MEVGERDPVTGRLTTGHEWNGIKELYTPVPRVVIFFLVVGALFAVGYWILMPAWPLGRTYTKGLLGIDQRAIVERQVEEASAERAAWTQQIDTMDFAAIKADPALMEDVRDAGRTLFGDNCAVCHGTRGTGGKGFPDLTAGAWLWGGDPETVAETLRVGINSSHDETRVSQMMALGRDATHNLAQIGVKTVDPHPQAETSGIWFRDPEGVLIHILVAPKVSPETKVAAQSPVVPRGAGAAPARSKAGKVRPRRERRLS